MIPVIVLFEELVKKMLAKDTKKTHSRVILIDSHINDIHAYG